MRGNGNRRRLALFACLAWVFAVVGLPALHEARHDADHTHTAEGAIVHQHDARGHHVTAKKRTKQVPRLAIDHPVETGHQAAGVAHHAVALHQAMPPALPPVVLLEAELSSVSIEIPAITIGTQPSARGPPTQS